MDSSDGLNVGDVTGPRWAGGTRNPGGAEKAISDVSHSLEFAFGPNLNGWPDNPTRYFGQPARDAVMAGRASRDAEVGVLREQLAAAEAVIESHQAYLDSMMDGENDYTSASFHLHALRSGTEGSN